MLKKNKIGYRGEGYNPGHQALRKKYKVSQFVKKVSMNVGKFFDLKRGKK